jgi:exonuclease III
VAVLQECRPSDGTGVWFPTTSSKGVGIWAGEGYRIQPVPCSPVIKHSVFPAAIEGPESFHLLAAWTQALPSYVGAVFAGLDAYSEFVQDAPTVVIGDFNSSPALRDPGARRAHETLLKHLREDWGLVSAYHHRSGARTQEEMPTYYHQFDGKAGYHLDYCFIPCDWVPRLSSVIVAGPEEFTSSDHRPLLVDVSPLSGNASVA